MPYTWPDVEEFFLRMAGSTWAAGLPANPIPGMPGWEGYRAYEGNLLYIDQYCSAMFDPEQKRGASMGHSFISDDDQLFWMMQYGGWWVEYPGLMNFLKEALMTEYADGRFTGGRGPTAFQRGNFIYFNRVASVSSLRFPLPEGVMQPSSFKAFEGVETVQCLDQACKLVHCHYYSGMALVDQLPE